ncbi:MAG: hypothetical protein VX777_07685 [Chlamydiota bacterium]|nr:hypothetical protein [Chlamydiota bacterium]
MTISSVDESDKIFYQNLYTLMRKGDSLEDLAVGRNDKLKLDERYSFTKYFGYFASKPDDVRRVLQRVITRLNELRGSGPLKGQSPFPSDKNVSDEDIKYLISEKFQTLGSEIFDPLCLYDKKNIQNILVPELGELRKQKLEGTIDSEDSGYKMRKAISKAKLMFMLNVGLSANKGATGSIVISWFGQKPIGIFKPKKTNESTLESIVNWWKYQLQTQVSHLKTAAMARPRAEVAAHILDTHLGVGITCPTVLTEFKGEIFKSKLLNGSFQLYARDTVEAAEIKAILDCKEEFHEDEIKNFQMMTILDYLMGDLDGHEENWLVKKGKGCLIAKLYKIDNANSFIKSNPERAFLTDCKQYVWSEWVIAEKEFVDCSKKLMLSLTSELIEQVIDNINHELPLFLDEDIIRLLKQRARVLFTLASLEIATPKFLGQLQTDEEIEGFLRLHEQIAGKESQKILETDFIVVDDYLPD